MTENKVVCHISFNHSAFDDRIYWKELLFLKDAGYHCTHIAVGSIDADFISAHGIRLITVSRRRFSKLVFLNKVLQLIFRKKGTINKIFQIASNLNAAIYHYHDLQINIIAKDLKKLPQKPKIIYDAHEAYHLLMLENFPENPFYKPFYKLYVYLVKKWELKHAGYCNRIIVTDEYTLQYFRKNLPKIKTDIIYNYSYFDPEKIEPVEQKFYDLIYTGHISKGRGVKEAIEVVSILKTKMPDIKFLLIGSFENDDYKTEILSSITELGVTDNILLENFVPFEKISCYYSNARIGIGLFHKTPKYSSFIPIKLFEYMAFGLPTVFSDHGPAAEIVKKENCGLLVDYTKTQQVADSIHKLLLDKIYFKELSENGKKAVVSTYSWRKEKNELLKVYRNLVQV